MAIDTSPRSEIEKQSLGSVMKELGNSTKGLIQSELNLLATELRVTAQNVGRHMTQAVAFGALLVLSIFPFMAFLVIGLGDLLQGRYWLSSLLVAVAFAAIGGPLAFRSFKKIRDFDYSLPHTKSSINEELATARRKFEDVKSAAKGDVHGSQHFN